MLVVVENQLVVNFVRKDHQIVPPRQFGDLFQHCPRAHRAGGIIGIDQHNAAGVRSDLSLDVVEIGLPGVFLIQVVGVEADPKLGQHRRVQRVVRARRQ